MSKVNVLYQHGTMASLVGGLLKGTINISKLLSHGNTGIGTGEGLDGELIILGGRPYQVNAKGKVKVVSNDFTLPFANAHFSNFKSLGNLNNLSQKEFNQKILKLTHLSNTFFSVQVKGNFSQVKTRAVVKSEPPYDTLAQASSKQKVFSKKKVSGTLLSYFAPKIFSGVCVGGFHHHFLSKKHDFGGHVLNFHLDSGELYLQKFDSLDQHLPIHDVDYMSHDFNQDNIIKDINKAEKG